MLFCSYVRYNVHKLNLAVVRYNAQAIYRKNLVEKVCKQKLKSALT
ncbi:hypothetical protein VCHA38P217_40227 [Vibrio chagasii]|nr:hypothetical protein VCHA34P120_240004 [Vibrio chagasii]CAH7011351.1 hypothetical protein VCHA34P115_50311 [Vibrio chagasii]CAH7013829.1 hypothetical protein VCHA36O157_50310 [Vibrio chagasii]CAH7042615.1 hypothetical protein VCHA43O270_10304 [Vibrio chagasii]CAH7219403.1 hypothetical protein VCHA37P191_20186 [Vibrio chagasii]